MGNDCHTPRALIIVSPLNSSKKKISNLENFIVNFWAPNFRKYHRHISTFSLLQKVTSTVPISGEIQMLKMARDPKNYDLNFHGRWFFLSFVALLMPLTTATYSIIATDAETKQVGGAGATCIADRDIFEAIYLSSPGKSVLHVQGLLLDPDGIIVKTAKQMMDNSEPLEDVLNEMKEKDTDNYDGFDTVDLRQYGIANFTAHDGYTGDKLQYIYDEVLGVLGSVQKNVGKKDVSDRYIYHALGNVVLDGTVESMQSGFEDQNDEFDFGACDMAGRLMAAMNRVANEGLGDKRCVDDEGGISAAGGYLHIDNEDGSVLLHINIVGDGSSEPVELMKESFMEWRENNPCPDSVSGASTLVYSTSSMVFFVSILSIVYYLIV
mmetsp:Transcript_4015/g.6122  ORF Transcript_4015/g.6122 Transcript_4015/m.6122 type:complete len:380 (+) Transcript_4015:151-1290(+)